MLFFRNNFCFKCIQCLLTASNYKFLVIIGLFVLLHIVSLAGESRLEIELSSPDTKKAVQSAVDQVSHMLAEKFIGSLKLKEQKKQIQKTISAFSNRFILYTKTDASQKKANGTYIVPVTIGFSEENFKQILLQEGLFYSQSSNLRILPLILFEDRLNNESYSWWVRKKGNIATHQSAANSIYNALQNTLMSYGFYVINPEFVNIRYFVPDDLWFRRPKKKNIFKLARFFQAHLVLTGSIKMRETGVDSILNLNTEMSIYNTESGRLLADVKHLKKVSKKNNSHLSQAVASFLRTNESFGENLGVQLKSIYESGQILSNVLKITIQGELNYRKSQEFKKKFVSKVPSVINLVENIIRDQSVTYIANTNAPIDTVSKNIEETSLSDFYVRVSRVKRNEIILKVNQK